MHRVPPYPAELYALLHRGSPGDRRYYARACAGAHSVLELGCGYGRVLERLVDVVPEVVGLDRDPELLALAAARLDGRAQLVEADMRSFALGRRFDRVLVPHSGIYCLLDEDACVQALRCAAAHLASAGRLVVDAYVADHFHRTADPEDLRDETLSPVVAVEWRERIYDVFERARWQREQQRLVVTYEYIPRGGGEALLGTIEQRYWLAEQIEPLFGRAGLRVVRLVGDLEGGPLCEDGELWLAEAVHG